MAQERPIPTEAEVWRRFDAVEARLTAHISERMLDLAGLQPGMRVLDLASGRGEPALRAAQRVGPTGFVLGVDPQDSLLQMARESAAAQGLRHAVFRALPAEDLTDDAAPTASFDAVTCRWGLMSMAEPVRALKHARRALRPGGVLVVAVWCEPARVPYFLLPRELLEPYRTVPPVDPRVPGTFRYADAAVLEQDLALAGLRVDHSEERETPVFESADALEMVSWVRALGLTRLLNGLPDAVQQAWERDLVARLDAMRTDGRMQLGGVTRLVRAVPA